MKILSFLLLVLSALSIQSCATHSTMTEQKTPLSLNKIYAERYFAVQRGTYFRWLDDGSGYTVLEPRKTEDVQDGGDENSDETENATYNPEKAGVKGNDIVFYNVDGSGRKVLVAFESLTPRGKTQPIAVDDYIWSDDGKWVLIYTNSKKVWRSRSRGDYFLLNLETKSLTQLGPEAVKTAFVNLPEPSNDQQADAEKQKRAEDPESSRLMFAKFSPDSSKVAYVYKNNIYYQTLNDDQVHTLTTDGNDIIINGNFDWVYEEELAIADGFRWSPDSEKIAYWQLDTSGVEVFTMINNTDELYPTLTTFPYPKAGETNSAVRVGVVNLSTQETQWLGLEGDNRDRYIPRINWANGSELLVQEVNRPQQRNQLWLFNIEQNTQQVVFTDTDDAFIEYYYDADFINDGQHFIWHSERDGWRHLYRISKDGSDIVDLTPGEFDMISLLAYNEARNRIYFIASPDDPGQRYLFEASLDGSMKPRRITPDAYEGSNAYVMSKDASNALHHYSSFNTPTISQTIKVAGHKSVKALIDNEKLKARLQEVALPNHEFITLSAQDGTQLDAYIMTPQDLDPSKRYPIIFYVYGEPAGSTVQDRWGAEGYLYRALLVQEGFIVASVDNRGTRAPKGREWRKSIYKKIGSITAQDQVDAFNEMAQRYAFIDTERVGVFGHSGGGSSTLTMLFKHGDKYHAGTAIAPVPDISLYDTIYQERYSGHPKTDPESYFNTSSINFVEGFSGKLLLIHGTGDDNVHYQGAERLINELVAHNKQFEFMSYPNRSHGIREGKNTVEHRQTLMLDFFKRHLQGEK
ncbi:S9 family peptidase [Glaciecola siphonariae]|uniref:S9 family peptidase n=1 Tax=Glaciecola siphonariae TaxID=521012 RepID=A0ABV9LZ63_9ALTE